MDHKQDFLIQIKIPFRALDEIEARHILSDMQKDWNKYITDDKLKLQKLSEGKAPEGVKVKIGP